MPNTVPQQLWTIEHPDKSYQLRCLIDPHVHEVRLVTSAGHEVLREVHLTTADACDRAAAIKSRLTADRWR